MSTPPHSEESGDRCRDGGLIGDVHWKAQHLVTRGRERPASLLEFRGVGIEQSNPRAVGCERPCVFPPDPASCTGHEDNTLAELGC